VGSAAAEQQRRLPMRLILSNSVKLNKVSDFQAKFGLIKEWS